MLVNKNKKEVLIQGDISESEVQDLENLNENIKVSKLLTKAYLDQDFLHVIFNDFSLISFTRDLIISDLLTASFNQVKIILQVLKERNKKVKNLSFEYEIQSKDSSSLFLNITSTPEKMEIFIDRIDESINFEFINNSNEKSQIFVSLDENDKITIQKF